MEWLAKSEKYIYSHAKENKWRNKGELKTINSCSSKIPHPCHNYPNDPPLNNWSCFAHTWRMNLVSLVVQQNGYIGHLAILNLKIHLTSYQRFHNSFRLESTKFCLISLRPTQSKTALSSDDVRLKMSHFSSRQNNLMGVYRIHKEDALKKIFVLYLHNMSHLFLVFRKMFWPQAFGYISLNHW